MRFDPALILRDTSLERLGSEVQMTFWKFKVDFEMYQHQRTACCKTQTSLDKMIQGGGIYKHDRLFYLTFEDQLWEWVLHIWVVVGCLVCSEAAITGRENIENARHCWFYRA